MRRLPRMFRAIYGRLFPPRPKPLLLEAAQQLNAELLPFQAAYADAKATAARNAAAFSVQNQRIRLVSKEFGDIGRTIRRELDLANAQARDLTHLVDVLGAILQADTDAPGLLSARTRRFARLEGALVVLAAASLAVGALVLGRLLYHLSHAA